MTIGSLFSGIGGLELGLEMAGLGPTLWQCENNPFSRRILSRYWPEARLYDDVRTLDPSALAPVHVLCGGFPCTDVSSAGKRAGLSGSQSGLWYEFARVVEGCRPRWVVIENVASGAKLWVDAVRGDLERIGYATLPVPLSAADVGAPHLRRRIFVLGRLASDSNGQGQRILSEHAEVESPPEPDPSPDGFQLREQPRRCGWSGWPGETLAAQHSGWQREPGVARVGDGLPGEMDRLRALGNAVVPQCAQVIGWMIRELESA